MGSRDSIRQALSLAHAGDRRGAIAALRAAVAGGSSCAELHFQLGLQLAADDRYEEAEAQFREAVRLDRGHADALWNLAMCVGLHGRTDQALGYLEQAHRLRPNDARIGLLYTQATAAPGHGGLISRAESAVPQLDPPHVATLSAQIGGDPELVDAFLVGEPDAEASAALTTLAAALREALRVRDDPRLHFQLGRVLARAGGLEEAIPSLERAISLRPGFVQALIELGKLLVAAGRPREGAERLQEAVRAGGQFADVFYQLGNAYEQEGKVLKAKTAFRRALELNGRYDAARRALAELPA